MKSSLTTLMIALMAAIGAGNAQAALQTLDYTGYTVSYDDSLFQFNIDFFESSGNSSWLNLILDPRVDVHAESFEKASSASLSFSLTVQAKAGWGIDNSFASYTGYWQENLSNTFITDTGSVTTNPGSTALVYHNVYKLRATDMNDIPAGPWFSDYAISAGALNADGTLKPNSVTKLTYEYAITLDAVPRAGYAYIGNTYHVPLSWNPPGLFLEVVAFNAPIATVPEPGSCALVLAGLGILGGLGRRRAKQ